MRDIEVCLQSQRDKLYRMGFRGQVSRSTLADANANRSFLIYQDFGLHLIARARRLYQHEPFSLDLKHVVLALDSTTIDLCLSVFPWAHFRTTKAAVKAHTLLDLRGSIPTFVALTSAKVHDVLALDWIPLEPGSILTIYGQSANVVKTQIWIAILPVDRYRQEGMALTRAEPPHFIVHFGSQSVRAKAYKTYVVVV